jgi:hypothetical protein
MDDRILFGLLMVGEGNLALNYTLFCFLSGLGAVQYVAARYSLRGLLLFTPRTSRPLGLAVVAGAYVWFFNIQPDLFIPGLAGGELLCFAMAGFGLALALALVFGVISRRPARPNLELNCESIPLTKHSDRGPSSRKSMSSGRQHNGEWITAPDTTPLVLVLALRESPADHMDVLVKELVRRGAGVLLAEARAAPEAHRAFQKIAARYPHAFRMACGVGRGADAVLASPIGDDRGYRRRLALAPFGENRLQGSGLQWLVELDYLTALRYSRSRSELPSPVPTNAVIVYAQDDALVPASLARSRHPDAIVVAGALHFDLAAHPTVLKVASKQFGLAPAEVLSPAVRVPHPSQS